MLILTDGIDLYAQCYNLAGFAGLFTAKSPGRTPARGQLLSAIRGYQIK